ncbi:MAG TPA: MFS transporter [Mycobacteriales bacterium]|nr:MFS transporter [Mycobacteriales bacterium]
MATTRKRAVPGSSAVGPSAAGPSAAGPSAAGPPAAGPPAAKTAAAAADLAAAEIAQTKAALRENARRTLGVTGEDSTEGFRTLLRRHQLSVYPIVALGLLYVCDGFQGTALVILSPNVGAAIGIGIAGITAARAIGSLAATASPLPMAALAQHKARRAVLSIVTGVLWSITTLFTGFIISAAGLVVILVLDGLSTGSVYSLHVPLIVDNYHPSMRVRAVAAYQSFGQAGSLVSPLLVALLAGPFNLTWRGVFLALGLISLGITLVSVFLRDPGFGKWDTEQLRNSVHEAHGEGAQLVESDVQLGFWEICRRVTMIPTAKRLMASAAVLGLMLIPFQTFISFFLLQRWNLGASSRALFFAYASGMAAISLVIYGMVAERQFRRTPAAMLRATGFVLVAGVMCIAFGGFSPWYAGMLAGFGVGIALIYVLLPAVYIALMSIVPANMRAHAQALATISIGVGSLIGALLLGNVENQYGAHVALIVIAVVALAGALALSTAGKFIVADLDRMIDNVLEDEEIKRITSAGTHLPMLACRGIDFSYGQLQVLFDVDFTVDDGEMVALLGTNGAGKSTLLKVISGIGLPSKGSVRYGGQEITYLDAERRLRLGITQVPGGRAVFGPMTVTENLRSYGYSLDVSRRELSDSIDACFAAFPRLYERRTSLASTLSGGEQQMLGLSKALMLKPRLLVIDELSLGLAPVIVGQLLEMVKRINAGGTAVVLVEQSVNIALNLVEHAFFMEKGEMRFDGASAELLARDDLLRAVFLHGTAAGARS